MKTLLVAVLLMIGLQANFEGDFDSALNECSQKSKQTCEQRAKKLAKYWSKKHKDSDISHDDILCLCRSLYNNNLKDRK